MEPITGIILAGGKSSRMGTDKGIVELNNKALIEYVIETLREVTDQIIIIANNNHYDKFGYEVYPDIIKEAGPMGGIYTGLFYSTTEHNFILSCDTPLLNKNILKEIIATTQNNDADVVIARDQYSIHPLCGIYRKRIINSIKKNLNNQHLKLKESLKKLKTEIVDFKDIEAFTNVNTPKELIDIERSVQLQKTIAQQ